VLTAVNLGARCGWVVGKRLAPASLLPRKEPVPLVEKAVWTLVPVRTSAENLANTTVRTPKYLAQPVVSRYTEYTALTA